MEIKEMQNTENLNSLEKLGELGFNGSHTSLDIALSEYGMAWKEFDPGKFLFVYGIALIPDSCNWNRFDRSLMFADEFDSYYDWADFGAVARCCGMEKDEWLAMPYPSRIFDLVSYYGTENVFGSCYWEGFEIEGLAQE